MAPHTQGQMGGPPGPPGLRAGGTCSPRSLGLLGAMLLMGKGFSEARLFLLGFLPAGWGRVFQGHLWLLDLELLQVRRERSSQALDFEEIASELGKETSIPWNEERPVWVRGCVWPRGKSH